MRKNDIKQNFINKSKPTSGLCTFLEDSMFTTDNLYPKTENHKKAISTIEQFNDNR